MIEGKWGSGEVPRCKGDERMGSLGEKWRLHSAERKGRQGVGERCERVKWHRKNVFSDLEVEYRVHAKVNREEKSNLPNPAICPRS
jgi:hypothetical protein